jgi:putative addiction module component (TIGR02574 family)
MKSTLQPVEHLGRFERLQLVEDLWDEFAAESGAETRQDVLDELERRAAWRDAHSAQGKSLAQIAQSLGVRL